MVKSTVLIDAKGVILTELQRLFWKRSELMLRRMRMKRKMKRRLQRKKMTNRFHACPDFITFHSEFEHVGIDAVRSWGGCLFACFCRSYGHA